MKALKLIFGVVIFVMLIIGTSSCLVYAGTDNGRHLGWYKVPNNSHAQKSFNKVKPKNNSKTIIIKTN